MLINKEYRKYERDSLERGAKKVFIFCEGQKREYQYFRFFQRLDSRIDIKPVAHKANQDNSPTGLFETARENIVNLDDFNDDIDEVWFVVDHEWEEKVQKLIDKCRIENWFSAINNPCFEVWLYYHFYEEIPQFEGIEISKIWKTWLNNKITGGFDFKRGADKINTAIKNSEKNYSETNGIPDLACTNVFKLGKVIFSFVGHRLE